VTDSAQLVIVRLEVREAGHVAYVAVNNPEKRNALGIAGKKALAEAFRQLARINGHCFGAGMEIAASCDMRIGVTTAKFGMPEVRFGIPSGMEACLLPRLIGWGKTRELVYAGDPIDAAEAHRCGFLEKLVEPAALDAGVEQWVSSILSAGPRAIRLQKKLVRDWERLSIEKAIQAGVRACTEARRTDEPRRLMTAFLARKKPVSGKR
jgi:enoyl-CoA hydratase/carnithine racemase